MKRALTVKNVLATKRNIIPFKGPWKDAMGCPELAGTILVWGPSGSGKTTFVLLLVKYLTTFNQRVVYDSLEEGNSESIKLALVRTGMAEVGSKFLLLDMEPINELKERLRRPKAPRVVVIDSFQYADLSYKEYRELRNEFRGTLFIFISHADGKLPSGRTAQKVRYDAHVKIRVEGYKAFCASRYKTGDPVPFTIWHQGAENYQHTQQQ